MHIHQGQRLQLLHRGGSVAYPDHIADAVLGHIPCGHGEILGGEKPLNGLHRKDACHISLLIGRLSGILQLFPALLQLLSGLFHLILAALDLIQRAVQLALCQFHLVLAQRYLGACLRKSQRSLQLALLHLHQTGIYQRQLLVQLGNGLVGDRLIGGQPHAAGGGVEGILQFFPLGHDLVGAALGHHGQGSRHRQEIIAVRPVHSIQLVQHPVQILVHAPHLGNDLAPHIFLLQRLYVLPCLLPLLFRGLVRVPAGYKRRSQHHQLLRIPHGRVHQNIRQCVDLLDPLIQLSCRGQIRDQIHLGGFQISLCRQQIPFGLRKLLGCIVLLVLQSLFAVLQLLPAVLQFLLAVQYLLFTVGKLLLSVLQSLPAVLQLLFRLPHFFVDGSTDLLVDGIYLILTDDDIHALLQQPRGADAGHTLDALQLRHDRILNICTDLPVIHAVHAHRRDHDRQHIRIQLHDNGVPDGVAPVALDLVEALPDFQ